MKFSEFLKSLKTKQNFSSTRDFFEFLGGEKSLEMSLRNFQLVESGSRPPSEKFFRIIITKIAKEEYRNAVIAYFASHMNEDGEEFLAYLDQHLAPSLGREPKSPFDSRQPTMMYSEEQLNYLIHNSDAMRLQHRLLLWRYVPAEALVGKTEIAQNLIRLGLAEQSSGGLRPSRVLFRVPTYENSAPAMVRKGSKYLSSILNNYISEEGAEQQRVVFSLRLVTPEAAKKILEQVQLLNKWIQGLEELEPASNLIPFLFVGYGKQLKNQELNLNQR